MIEKTFMLVLPIFFALNGISQETKEFTKEAALADVASQTCACIDSISTNQSRSELSNAIHGCIKKDVISYSMISQAALQIESMKDSLNADRENKINVVIPTDESSDEYKQYYYELQSYLMKNCSSLKAKMINNDELSDKSISTNTIAKINYDKGDKEAEKGNDKKAIKYYQLAIESDSNFAFAWDNMGLAYRRLKKYDKAIAAYKKSLEIDSSGTLPMQNMAITYQYMGEYEKAIATYLQIEKRDPNNPEVPYGIGVVCIENLKDYERGLKNMCRAYNLYILQNSPYRTDAEKMIQGIYAVMKSQGKEKLFHQILKENNITEK